MADERTEGVKLGEFLGILRRRIVVVVACVLLVPAIALAYTAQQPKKYSADALILLEEAGFESSAVTNVEAPSASAQDIATLIGTNQALAGLDTIAERTAARVGKGVTAGQVAGDISVAPSGDGQVLSVTSTDTDASKAAEIATVYAGQFVEFQRRLLRSRILRARRGIVAEADRLSRLQELSTADEELLTDLRRRERDLREREGDLTALAAVQTGNARVVQPAAVPGAPSSPKPVRNLIAGIGLGLLLGIGLAVLFHLLDRRLNNPEDIETLFESPTLGAIPRTPALSAKGGKAPSLPPSARESFRMLQTQMSYFNDHQPVRSVAVISAASGDGKSTVAWNLAVAGADAGARVLLVEADLRNPTLASRFDDAVESGLSDVLSSRSELADVVHPVPVGARSQNGGTTNRMDVVLAGPRPTNPRQLIASAQMRELLSHAEATYDLVVIDTPPTSIVSDAIPIIRSVGGVLVVTRLRKSTRSEVAHLREQLRNLDAPTLGVVINSIETRDGYYGAAYESARAYVGAIPASLPSSSTTKHGRGDADDSGGA